jgi:ectoine hydroxylase-related dioxygenase (phytanoyl-CoA dioxygenase family)
MTFHASAQQIEEFHRDGFLTVRQLFDADEMALLLQIAKSDLKITAEAHNRTDAAGRSTLLTVRNDLDDEQIYSAIARSRRVVETMTALLGDEVYHYHHKMMLKEPRVGGAWQWHQDYGYWYENGCLFPDMGSCLIAIDRATKQNGCLQIITGSHRLGRIDHGKTGAQTGADMTRVNAALEKMPLIYAELEPGDALFFHANTLHCSAANDSEHPRWSLICCYNTKHNDPIITGGRHPNYSPLEIWPDEKVKEVGRQQLAESSGKQ